MFYLIYCQFPVFFWSQCRRFFFVQVTYDMIEGMLNGALTLCVWTRVMVCSHSQSESDVVRNLVLFIPYKPCRLFTRTKDENDSDIVACKLLINRCCEPMLERRWYIAVTWCEQGLIVTEAQWRALYQWAVYILIVCISTYKHKHTDVRS